MRTIMIVCALVLGFVSLGSVSAENNRVDICHFQEESGSWKLLSVGQPAAGAHLEQHDDALPGGTTSQTGTVMDADCEEVTATCPCDYSQVPMTLEQWTNSPQLVYIAATELGRDETCDLRDGRNGGTFIFVGADRFGGQSIRLEDCGSVAPSECGCQYKLFDQVGFNRMLITTAAEAFACAAAINHYANALNNVAGIVVRDLDAPCRTAP